MPPSVAHPSSAASSLKKTIANQQRNSTASNTAVKNTVEQRGNTNRTMQQQRGLGSTSSRRISNENGNKRQNDQQIVKREETENKISAPVISASSPITPSPMEMPMSTSPYGGMMGGMGGYGMGLGGPMNMNMNMMGGGYGMGQGGNISSLSQYLFSFQSIIFSLGQAMQIVTMNTQQLHQLYDQIIVMFDQALKYLDELKHLESVQGHMNIHQPLTEEQIKKRRRLKAIRWTIMFGISYAGYKLVLKWYRKRREYTRARTRIASMSASTTTRQGRAQMQNSMALHDNHGHEYGHGQIRGQVRGQDHEQDHGMMMNGGNNPRSGGSHYNQHDYNYNQGPRQQNDYYSSYPSTSTYGGGYPGGYNSNYSPF